MRPSTSVTIHASLVGAILGAATAGLLAAAVLPGAAQNAPSAVAIDNFTFKPQQMTVKAGTTLTWTNKDDIPHGIASANNAFARSKALDTDDSYSFTFAAPGTYQYFCYLHPHMTGTIVVEPAAGGNAAQ
jgi:plastocyanin